MKCDKISINFFSIVSKKVCEENSPPICRGRQRGGKKTINKYFTSSILILLFLISIIQVSIAQIITVKQDGTGDYTTIQQAVDASIDGDTVLVYPGTYFENINYNGKNITVASLNLTTNNPAYIHQTIIDGNHSGSCVQIISGEIDVVLHGFTVQNGSGKHFAAIYYNGGGMYIENSNPTIRNCIIKDNFVNSNGGGLYCGNSSVTISGVTISNNYSYRYGGGISLSYGSSLIFDTNNLCNIYLNYSYDGCEISKTLSCPPLNIIVDTFTVINPDVYYIISMDDLGYPVNDITTHILHEKITPVDGDLYVNPNGNNNNSGIIPEEPLKSLSFALSKIQPDSIYKNTIHLANGIYSQSTTDEKFPLNLRGYITIEGQNRDSTILDAENIIYLLQGNKLTDNYTIRNLTLRNGNGNVNSTMQQGIAVLEENHNILLENLLVTEGIGRIVGAINIVKSNNAKMNNVEFYHNHGGKAFRTDTWHFSIAPPFTPDTVRVTNCVFRENLPDYDTTNAYGGGAAILGRESWHDSLTCYIINSLFYDNYCNFPVPGKAAGALAVTMGAEAFVVNCTFGNNTTINLDGAGIGVTNNASLNIYNSVLYDNEPAELYLASDSWQTCYLNIFNSLIAGGEEAIRIYNPQHIVYYDSTNIDLDPLWDTAGTYPYALTAASPCIDAGTLDLPAHIQLPDTDLAGNPRISGGGIDMGAYEYIFVGLPELPQKKPQLCLKAAPNPFNYGTYISYITKESGHIKIDVYDMNGRKVTTLMDVRQLPGSGEFYWDGTNNYSQKLPPGTYIINLIINDKIKESVKVIKK